MFFTASSLLILAILSGILSPDSDKLCAENRIFFSMWQSQQYASLQPALVRALHFSGAILKELSCFIPMIN